MQTEASGKLDAVEAVFGGKRVTFRLQQGAHWADVHDVWLGPLLALHQRILASMVTRDEVLRVLSLSYVGAPQRALAYVPHVEKVLTERPAGTFMPLAARILEAHIFGLSPDLATWDESEAFR